MTKAEYKAMHEAWDQAIGLLREREKYYPEEVFPKQDPLTPTSAAAEMARFTCRAAQADIMRLKNDLFFEHGHKFS